METSKILSLNFSLKRNQKNLPENIYAIKVLNIDKNEIFDIAIMHDGFCPNNESDRQKSNFGEYLSNLEYKLIDEYFKLNKIKKPKEYFTICEVITDDKGHLYRHSKSIRYEKIIC